MCDLPRYPWPAGQGADACLLSLSRQPALLLTLSPSPGSLGLLLNGAHPLLINASMPVSSHWMALVSRSPHQAAT